MTRDFSRQFVLAVVALGLSLCANSGMADDSGADSATAGLAAPLTQIEQRFRDNWVAANPEVYTRIARAFDSEAMNGADLMGVECRASLCRLAYRADSDIPVRKLLTMQLANSYKAMVTVHTGRDKQLYVDIPQVYRAGDSVARAH